MTTHTLVQSLPFNKLFSLRLPKINWKVFLVLSFCLTLFFLVFYVFQVNEMLRDGYLMKSYQKKVDTLLRENKNLEISLAQISYLENIQKKTQELSFKNIQTIKYIQILDSSLAKR